ADAVRERGFAVVGLDLSADQLRMAAARLPVVRADATQLPIRDSSVHVAFSVLTHTDLSSFDGLVEAAVRALRPGVASSTSASTRASSTRSPSSSRTG